RALMEAGEAAGDDPRDRGRGQLACGVEERRAALVFLADHEGPERRRQVVELLLDLRLDQRPLLLDDEHLVDAGDERLDDLGLEGPAHADLQQTNAERRGPAPV